MSSKYGENVNAEAYSVEEYRKRMNSYLDHVEEEFGDDAVILLGSLVGEFSFNGPTDSYPRSHRIRGNIGYPEGMFDTEAWEESGGEGNSPLREAFEERRFNALLGSLVLSTEYVSEQAKERIEESGSIAAKINPAPEEESDAD